ncbi:MAG: peptide ABC transporter substrate-binding protein [Chlamydiales bacterium]
MGLQRTRFVIVFFALLCACSAPKEREKKVLHLTYLDEPNSVDPRFGYEIPANHTVKMLYEGLLRSSHGGELLPGIAEGYEISQDRLLYTFFLRDAFWSNGAPVTAFDFVNAWKSILDPKIPTQGSSDFYPIKNAEAIVCGGLPVDSAGIVALDNKTLQVELEYPAPYFLELVATSAFSPFCEKDVYNGPFQVEKWESYKQIVLKKNPYFWNAEKVEIEKIEIAIVPDVQTQIALFEKGYSDWLGKPFAKLSLDAVPSLSLTSFPERAIYWYFLNTQKFPFDNAHIRRAFALAVDREAIVQHILKEGEKAALSINPGHIFFHDSDTQEAIAEFEKGLQELEIQRADFPKIPLSFCNIETNIRIAQVVKEQWEKVLGVRVILDPQEWTLYYDNLSNGKLLIGGLSWHARIRDPIYNLQLFSHAQDRLNMSQWEDPLFQEKLGKAKYTVDLVEREQILLEAEEILFQHMPVIPIYFLVMSYAQQKGIEGVYLSDMNEIDFTYAHMKIQEEE